MSLRIYSLRLPLAALEPVYLMGKDAITWDNPGRSLQNLSFTEADVCIWAPKPVT